MAKDMSKVYGEMLTKELVSLREKHKKRKAELERMKSRSMRKYIPIQDDLIAQINKELADRVSQVGIFA